MKNHKSFALDKRFIDHVALSADMTIGKMSFISRFGESGQPLSALIKNKSVVNIATFKNS
jgi:hypothetical protein